VPADRNRDIPRDRNFLGIEKVGAVAIKNGHVLAVRKVGQTSETFILAGGRIRPGEVQTETLRRETLDELGVEIGSWDYIGTFEDVAALEGEPIRIHCYLIETRNEPQPCGEIGEVQWLDAAKVATGEIVAGSILAYKVIPALVRLGFLPRLDGQL
jgi:ADP-ribose pyrophosphatase YjhB (NUDIX family)